MRSIHAQGLRELISGGRIAVAIVAVIIVSLLIFFIPAFSPRTNAQNNQNDQGNNAANEEERPPALIGGWAWNQTLGWVSQRHIIRDADTQDRIGEFGVVKYDGGKDNKGNDLPDEIEGWSWSSVYGFICWGRTCATLCTTEEKKAGKCSSSDQVRLIGGSTIPPTGGTPSATVSKEKKIVKVRIGKKIEEQKLYEVHGWAKILQLRDRGWIQLSGCSTTVNQDAPCPDEQKFGIHFDDFTNEFRGWAWNNVVGWFAFSGKTLYDTPYSYALDPQSKDRYEIRAHPVTGQAVVFLPNEQISIAAAVARGLQVILDASACLTQKLCENVGFVEKVGKSPWRTQYVGPRIETSGGTAFARKGFDLSDIDFADEAFTGEYKDSKGVKQSGILTGSTRLQKIRKDKGKKTPGKSFPGAQPNKDPRVGALRVEFPSPSINDKNRLVSSMGVLHKLALTTLSPSAGVKNKYGYDVAQINQGYFQTSVNNRLGGKIHLYKPAIPGPGHVLKIGTETARAPHTIMNSLSAAESGAGSVVAYGADIHIYAPFRYDDTALPAPPLSRLASVAWIALKDEKGNGGNIFIDDCIPPFARPDNKGYFTEVKVDGLFFAEGAIETGSGDGRECMKKIDATPGLDDATKTAYKNAFRSAISAIDISLVVEGAMIASEFVFQRVYGGYNIGSENINDTGRAQINPPPGIADIIRSLPVK